MEKHYLNLKSNDYISQMNQEELNKFLDDLNGSYLKLRENLGFDKDVTFGLEIEFEHADYDAVKKELCDSNLNKKWRLGYDYSLIEGREITSPILRDNSETWETVKQICSYVTPHAVIDNQCGGHIHVGAHLLKNQPTNWLNFIRLWQAYENIIFRFTYGEYTSARLSMKYSKPVKYTFDKKYDEILKKYQEINPQNETENEIFILDDIIKKVGGIRNRAINFGNITSSRIKELNNTIEFRCPNGTLNPIIWQNNVNLLVNILLCSTNNNFNKYVVDARVQKNEIYDDVDLILDYDEIYLEQALEFADLVFTDNLNKMYFLRQYLKSFQVEKKSLVKAKKFTK